MTSALLRSSLLRRLAIGSAALAALAAAAVVGLDWADRAFPPPLPPTLTVSTEVVDRDGQLLRAYTTVDGKWRLATGLDQVDKQFVDMLIAYEDKRFHDHRGVDVLALLRAARQFVTNGRIVSGGSTLSMQLARLIEPREGRSFGEKAAQVLRAWQIERRLSKREILERYLTLAPYGGNLEGVRAASLAYFGKEPKRLTLSEAALLVALPQLPERRRPDRNQKGAKAARDRVLERMARAGVIAESEVARAGSEIVSDVRLPMPTLAPHAADAALRADPARTRHTLTIRKSAQAGLEQVARQAAAKLGPRLSVAMVLADARSGEILAEIGSADYLDASRSGWIDMTGTVRSPGSTLKPFIYGLALEDGLVMQETIVEDRPANFSGYRPRNFDMGYQGDVTIRNALQLSLNVPAIRLLEAVGPVRLMSRMRSGGAAPRLPAGELPGLAIGLGGAGLTLERLVQLYTGLASGGRVAPLRLFPDQPVAAAERILTPQAVWQVTDMLAGVAPPQGAPKLGIAYKTGTSYGYRDAWSVGYDGRHVLGVWVGRPDGGSVPGLTGYLAAAPILFDAFTKTGIGLTPLPRPPAGALRLAASELPFALRRFAPPSQALVAGGPTEPAPEIVYPPQGARVELGQAATGRAVPLALKLNGGRAPFRWLANGRPVEVSGRRRTASWTPDGAGFQTLTVIDAAGRAASVQVFVE